MKLVVVSHTPHYLVGEALAGWGSTVRELDRLAALVDQLIHVAPVYHGPAPESSLTYEAPNVRVRAVPPAGGETFLAKLGILGAIPAYVTAIHEELHDADIVHVRCPSNISLIALLQLAFRGKPERRWMKYAGSWPKQQDEPWSYAFQRWWLNRAGSGAIVTVNGNWPGQQPHVHGLLNPCLTDEELFEARTARRRELTFPIRLLFAGSLLPNKGAVILPEVVRELHRLGISTYLDIVGDGPERGAIERLVEEFGLGQFVKLHGWVPRPALSKIYPDAHFLLLPSGTVRDGVWSTSEGWPKVIGEALAHGVVPIASPVSSIPQYLHQFQAGSIVEASGPDAYANAVAAYVRDPGRWSAESTRAVQCGSAFTYSSYIQSIASLVGLPVDVDQQKRTAPSPRGASLSATA